MATTTTTTTPCVILSGPTAEVLANIERAIMARAAAARRGEIRRELAQLPTARLEALARVGRTGQFAPWYRAAITAELRQRAAATPRRRSSCDCRGFCGCP